MKIKATLHRIWQFIKDAFRPEWILDRTKEEEQVRIHNDVLKQTITHDDGTAEHNPHEALEAFEEITRLKQRVAELEKDLSSCGIVMETTKKLNELSESRPPDRRGRPPKPHVRVSLNLATQWSLLFQLGKNSGLIIGTMTEFINNAFGYYLQTQYASLYALYQDSITNTTDGESIPP